MWAKLKISVKNLSFRHEKDFMQTFRFTVCSAYEGGGC